MITPPAIFQPAMSKTAVARAAPALSTKSNVILIRVTPEPTLTVARRPAAVQAAKMTAALITPNAAAPRCMNGAPQPRNVFARQGINTLVRGVIFRAETATAAMESIRNANARRVLLGTHRVGCASAPAPTGVRSIRTARRSGISSRVVRASSSNAPSTPIMRYVIRAVNGSPDLAALVRR